MAILGKPKDGIRRTWSAPWRSLALHGARSAAAALLGAHWARSGWDFRSAAVAPRSAKERSEAPRSAPERQGAPWSAPSGLERSKNQSAPSAPWRRERSYQGALRSAAERSMECSRECSMERQGALRSAPWRRERSETLPALLGAGSAPWRRERSTFENGMTMTLTL